MISDSDPFHDCELDPGAILGTHTFEDVLFTNSTETPVNVLTDETSAHSQAIVEETKEFTANIDTEAPQIALPASMETQIERQSKPYTSTAFLHFRATDSLERHRVHHTAYNSGAFTVDFEADYGSGNLTITVGRANKSWDATTRTGFSSADDEYRRDRSEQATTPGASASRGV